MNQFISLFLIVFASFSASAYIPRASMILSRTAENTGKGIYLIEQEVQFPNGADTVSLKETWIIENENNMRLIVSGTKELKDLVSMQISYPSGKRIGEDFIEKYFHLRTTEALAQTLSNLKIVPSTVLAKRGVRLTKEADYQPENFVRLSRVGGVITYALGMIGGDSEASKPGFWIEQDQFLIRKFRLPSQVEVSADRFENYARGLSFPGIRNVKWNNQQVTIQTISVKAVGKEALTNFSAKPVAHKMNIGQLPAAAMIDDFYKRLR